MNEVASIHYLAGVQKNCRSHPASYIGDMTHSVQETSNVGPEISYSNTPSRNI